MKKTIGLILALCLILSFTAGAFAASKPSITKQPETATTSKKGSVSFSITVKGKVDSYTWYFVNPATGEKISGSKLAKSVKGVKVNRPNSKKVTLSNVPESMHGWQVYCHINGNGYKLDSETVLLLVYGLEPPAGAASSPTDAEPSVTADAQEIPAEEPAPAEPAPVEPTPEEQPAPAEPAPEETPAETTPVNPDSIEFDAGELENKTITISCASSILRKLDTAGNVVDMEPAASLEFLNTGSFVITAADPIKNWTVNGIRYEPSSPVTEIRVMNVTTDISLDVQVSRASAASAQLDTEHMCKVTCKGCTFTFLSAGIRSAAEGEVPAGAPIRVMADTSDGASKGYSINGSEPQNLGLSSFQFTVTEDVTITVE